MATSDTVRRYLAPIVIVGLIGAIAYAAVQSSRSGTAAGSAVAPGAGGDRAGHRDTTTSSPYWTLPPTTDPSNPQVAMDSVQWSEVAYPGACDTGSSSPGAAQPDSTATPAGGSAASTGFTVDQVSFAQPASNVQLAIVLVQCGGGDQPVGLYVYNGATSVTEPTLAQTLIPESQDVFAGAFSIQATSISVQVTSGSPGRTGACCAGLTYEVQWIWSKGSYRPAS